MMNLRKLVDTFIPLLLELGFFSPRKKLRLRFNEFFCIKIMFLKLKRCPRDQWYPFGLDNQKCLWWRSSLWESVGWGLTDVIFLRVKVLCKATAREIDYGSSASWDTIQNTIVQGGDQCPRQQILTLKQQDVQRSKREGCFSINRKERFKGDWNPCTSGPYPMKLTIVNHCEMKLK